MAVTTEPRTATVSVTVGDQELTFETGKLAKQADGAVVVRAGETMVLATAQGKMEAREGADFFPLTVDVEERMYAAGKIPGGFFKREGRPTERAILTARMIDRPIRPLWPKGFRNEVHVVGTTPSSPSSWRASTDRGSKSGSRATDSARRARSSMSSSPSSARRSRWTPRRKTSAGRSRCARASR